METKTKKLLTLSIFMLKFCIKKDPYSEYHALSSQIASIHLQLSSNQKCCDLQSSVDKVRVLDFRVFRLWWVLVLFFMIFIYLFIFNFVIMRNQEEGVVHISFVFISFVYVSWERMK